MDETAKRLTAEEEAQALEYRRAQRRAYWERKTPEERAAKRKAAQKAFWDKLTPEEKRQKRMEYDLHRAQNAARRAAEKAEQAGA